MNISLAITTYNRYELTIESFKNVLSCDFIDEIIIVDDHSDQEIYDKLKKFCEAIPKIKLHRNAFRYGMAGNKRKAINLAKNAYVCIFDSDNEMGPDYFEALFKTSYAMGEKVICIPEKAEPNFIFTKYRGRFINSSNVKDNMGDEMFRCLLNCCNYVVPADSYMEVYEYDKTIKATDTIRFNYLWLKKGNAFFVVPGMFYRHLVHAGSGFLEDVNYNMAKAKEYEQKIMEL